MKQQNRADSIHDVQTFRAPADLRAALKQIAKEENRSVTGQIIHFLRKGIDERNKGASASEVCK
jgi:hypothetical protein